MLAPLLGTPEARRILLVFMLLGLLLWLIAALTVVFLTVAALERCDVVLAGALGSLPDESETARKSLADAIVGGTDAEAVARGRLILRRLGYTDRIDYHRKPALLPAVYLARRTGGILLLLYLPASLTGALVVSVPLFRSVRHLSETLRRRLDGGEARITVAAHGGLWTEFLGRMDQLVVKLDGAAERNYRIQAALRRNLADISHQLKTPIAAISLYNELLEAELSSNGELRKLVGRSQGAAGKLDRLTRDILKLTRVETGSISFRQESVDLGRLAEEAWLDLAPFAGERRCEFRGFSGAAAMIRGDAAWLKEAVGNVLRNAIQHTAEDGEITISLRATPLFRRLTVADNGGGIPEQDVPRLFQRFFTGSGSPTMEGTGIGLSLAREIVRANGGDLRARNGADGAEFAFTFLIHGEPE